MQVLEIGKILEFIPYSMMSRVTKIMNNVQQLKTVCWFQYAKEQMNKRNNLLR